MDRGVKKLYDAARNDRDFNYEAKKADPQGYIKPNMFSDTLLKHIYATTYYGWLVGKGKFKRSNFY